ncbi:MAG: hypothetical protein JXR31_10605, partial [Prolixibacteraceae bacterium]|nr:hypothetical protein [Prolixibacteraceae bacterium]
MKKILCIPAGLFLLTLVISAHAQCNLSKWVMEKGAVEAELIFRLGDIDNINSGFEEGYNPFSGELAEFNA